MVTDLVSICLKAKSVCLSANLLKTFPEFKNSEFSRIDTIYLHNKTKAVLVL